MKRLFFTFIDIPMKGMVLRQMGDKCLKPLVFFMPIMRGACEEWIESNLVHFQYYNPYFTIGILCENMFMRHAITSFHFPLLVEVSANFRV
jgi:hypothetical protein